MSAVHAQQVSRGSDCVRSTHDISPLPPRGREGRGEGQRANTDPWKPDADEYRRWRDARLRAAPRDAAALVVEVDDAARLRERERAAISDRLRRANMCVVASRAIDPDEARARERVRGLAGAFGLTNIDANLLSDEDGISSIRVGAGAAAEFIPYTERAIQWHTDGYYNPPSRRVRAFVLHCVRPAATAGGESLLLDHELAYIALRERDPEAAAALFAPDAMSIPARIADGTMARHAQAGPVFGVDEAGRLFLRYTARTTSIEWKDDGRTREAAGLLSAWLAGPEARRIRTTLQPGMAVISANVLHARSAFRDDPARPRQLLRARYFDGICI
jgi:hypothetical protein